MPVRKLNYARRPDPQEPREGREWPAWLIVLITATVMIGIIGGIFVYTLPEQMPAPSGVAPSPPIPPPESMVHPRK
jgi:hypothetical protein